MNTVWCMHTVSFPDSWLIWVESRIPVICYSYSTGKWCVGQIWPKMPQHTLNICSHKRWSVAEPKLLWFFHISSCFLFIFFIYFQPLAFSFSYFAEWIFCFSDTIYILSINLFIFILVFWIHKILSVSWKDRKEPIQQIPGSQWSLLSSTISLTDMTQMPFAYKG